MQIGLPWRLAEGYMEISFDEIRFDNHLLGPVPEEGISRLVTQTVSERRDHMVRYGLAFLLEHGFMVRVTSFGFAERVSDANSAMCSAPLVGSSRTA
jgi:hypothetical protein